MPFRLSSNRSLKEDHMATTLESSSIAIGTLGTQVRGNVIRPGDAEYESARKVVNGMIDRFPAVILRAIDAADVIAGVTFARDNKLKLAVRGGGHNVAGFGTVDDGMVVDLSRMTNVRVDPDRRVLYAGGGATWGDVDHAAWAFGLATTGGIISTTGVGGLGLGGGFGHLHRQFGLVVDNIRSADVVTADGRLVHANSEENPDLFWALRGGGGNFGVVTSFELALHPITSFYGGPIFFAAEEAPQLMRFYRDFIATAPRELGATFSFHLFPPAPFVPEHLHLTPTCPVIVNWTGPLDEAEEVLRPLREAATVLLDLAGPTTYPAMNGMFDALQPPGFHHYWKADFVSELTDEAIAIHTEWGPGVPTVPSLMHLYPLNGAVHDVASDATAFAQRDVQFVHVIVGADADGTNMASHKQWVRDYWAALHPHSSEGAYVNFMMDEGQDRIKATYGANYERLAAAKAKWDPANLFHLNQNIVPATS
jgi:FAD/FMN-containing dehydrogenase